MRKKEEVKLNVRDDRKLITKMKQEVSNNN